MFQNLMIWASENWKEIIPNIIAGAALFYAYRAYHSSKDAAKAANSFALTDLRIRAKDSMNEADRSFQSLQVSCDQARADWEKHKIKTTPPLSRGIFDKPEQVLSNARLENMGRDLLDNAKKHLVDLEKLNTTELTQGLSEIKTAVIKIESLIPKVESPTEIIHRRIR